MESRGKTPCISGNFCVKHLSSWQVIGINHIMYSV
jgi:hypothetical protein